MPPSFETLALTFDDKVATVYLNRPDKANAMNGAMWSELQTCFEWLDEESGVRAVILAGNGKHFCAGLDLAVFGELVSSSPDPARRAEQLRRNVLRLQTNLNAYFSVKEIDIGMTADVGTLQRLPRLIPDGVVRELAYTGRKMDAEEAQKLGFLNRLFDNREVMMREVTKIAHAIAAKSPLAIRGTKEMLLYSRDHSVADGLNYIATWNAGMMSQMDLKAGLDSQTNQDPGDYED
jgi:enoyl-CoA hydratase